MSAFAAPYEDAALAPLKPDPQAVAQRNAVNAPALAVMTEVFKRNPPGQWSSDHWAETQHFTGIVYLAITALADAMSGATMRCVRRQRPSTEESEIDGEEGDEPIDGDETQVGQKSLRRFLKSASAVASNGEDEEYTPIAWDHSAAKLLEEINPVDTFPEFISQWFIQLELTGIVYVYKQRNRMGKVCALWVIPTAITNYIPLGGAYPNGGVQVNNIGTYSVGFLPSMSCMIPGEDLLIMRNPHPLYRQTGLSKMWAGSRQIDLMESIDESRKTAMDKGVNPDVVVTLDGANQTQCEDFAAKLTQGYGGSKNHRKALVTNGQGLALESLTTPAKEMDYQSSWEQTTKFCSALFGVPPAVMGLTEASSYAEFYAKLKQFHTLKLTPEAKKMAAIFTKHLLREWDDDLYCEIEIPKIDDAEQRLRELAVQPSDLWTYNEARAVLNLKPVRDGDQPTNIVLARRNFAISMQQQQEQAAMQASLQAAQPGQAAAQPQPGGEQPPQEQQPEQAPDVNPEDALHGALLHALGVSDGSSEPVQKALVSKALAGFADVFGGAA